MKKLLAVCVLGVVLCAGGITTEAETTPNGFTSIEDYVLTENIMSQFYECNWNKYSIEEKKILNILLAQEICAFLDIETPSIDYSNRYTWDDKYININEDVLDSSQETYKSIANEIRRYWQYFNKDLLPKVYKDNSSKINEYDSSVFADTLYLQLIHSEQY